ncbi:MAG: ATP-binding protein, partial [Blastocatellia bacterium]
ANIINHAYAGREDRLIQIEAQADDESLSFELGHFGVPFEPKVPDVPAFDGSREGGFGLFIISQLADKVTYSTDDTGRHVVRLAKRLEGGGRVEIRNEE